MSERKILETAHAAHRCEQCGQPIPPAMVAGVSTWGMFDCHMFTRIPGSTPTEVAAAWRAMCEQPGERGAPNLCPIILATEQGKDLRRVGQMVHWGSEDMERRLAEWLAAATSDPDVVRLLAARAPALTPWHQV